MSSFTPGPGAVEITAEAFGIFTEPPFRATSLPGYMHDRAGARFVGVCVQRGTRVHARTQPRVRHRHGRDTRGRPCICFAYIRHGFGHGHTEHNLGESINELTAREGREREREKRESEKERERMRERARVGGTARGTTGPRHATFGFIVVYPAAVRFPRRRDLRPSCCIL